MKTVMATSVGTLTAAALLSGAMMATGEAAPSAPAGDRGHGDRGHTVTLVTGDQVLLGSGARGIRATPVAGNGRAGMRFLIQREGAHMYVIPTDAARLVATGTLDRQLFDVAKLDKDGYDDAGTLPLIVQGGAGIRSLAGTRDVRALPVINGAAMRIPKGDTTFWRTVAHDKKLSGGIRKIWLDAKVRMSLDHSVPQIGAPDAWTAGYTGKGVKVAVLDSGADATHPDLTGRIAAQKNFTPEADTDLVGHGTHVAATVASNDSVYRGVAPDASLLIGKVIVKEGFGAMSWLLAAMEWASTEQHADVVNMSLGGPDGPEIDPVEEAVNRLTAQNGTLFVIGAGNTGELGETTVGSPSTADAALSVGAVDQADALAPFSSRGPRVGDYGIKPDITAPGVGIVAARSKDGRLGDPSDTHMSSTGTSMSTPHVAGAAALLVQEHPDWSPARIKAALMGSAKPTPGASPFDQGAGRVDLTRATTQKVLTDQPSIGMGKALWPHNDDQPITRPVTYRNTGDTDVTLHLTVQATGPDGRPATVFTLSETTLIVPAGGTASVTLTADTRAAMPDGNYTGYVVATGAATTVRTAVAVVREVESYDVTVTGLDRDGNPALPKGSLFSYDGSATERTVVDDGTVRFRGPRGRYVLSVFVTTGDRETGSDDQFVAPWLDLSADRRIAMDARTTNPITVTTVDRKNSSLVHAMVGFVGLRTGGGFIDAWLETRDFSKVRTAQIGPDAPEGSLAASTHLPGGSFPQFDLVGMSLPSTRVELFTTSGVEWTTFFFQGGRGQVPFNADAFQQALQRTYRQGRHYTERWNGAVFGPSLPGRAGKTEWANQIFDRRLAFRVPLFGMAGDTAGESKLDSAHTVVQRDGTTVCSSERIDCTIAGKPPLGRYRVQAEATRSIADTSTKVSVGWEVDHDGTPALPVQVIRFCPALDAANSAPGDRAFAIPVAVQRNPGAKPAHVASLTVEVSYDDGAHWQHARLIDGKKVILQHPAGGYVSLRAKATDTDGNTVEQTIIHAYRVR